MAHGDAMTRHRWAGAVGDRAGYTAAMVRTLGGDYATGQRRGTVTAEHNELGADFCYIQWDNAEAPQLIARSAIARVGSLAFCEPCMSATISELVRSRSFRAALARVGLDTYANRGPVLDATTPQELADALLALAEKDGLDATVQIAPAYFGAGLGYRFAARTGESWDCDINRFYIITEAAP